jgi:hypothetical protein
MTDAPAERLAVASKPNVLVWALTVVNMSVLVVKVETDGVVTFARKSWNVVLVLVQSIRGNPPPNKIVFTEVASFTAVPHWYGFPPIMVV